MKDEERRNPQLQRNSDHIRDYDNQEEEPIMRTINVIVRGFAGGGVTKLARKRHLQEVLSLSATRMKKSHNLSATPEIVFSSTNFEGVVPGHDDAMIISTKMVNVEVKRIFIDQGSSADNIFRDAFDKLRLKNADLQSYKEELVRFSRENVYPDGFITLHVTLDSQPKTRTIKVDFLVINYPSAYNIILGRPTLNKIRAIVSIACLTMKFFTDDREIATVRVDQAAA